jgi:putative IMPACT (imprinted ancient) family translation regulator
MLDVLRHQELEGVLATVVRYLGGIKLGADGLVAATYRMALTTSKLYSCTLPRW